MTLKGAIKQLHELQNTEDMPIYYKPAIAEIINVLLMDTQEVRHGRWKQSKYYPHIIICDECGEPYELSNSMEHWNYCPNCGVKMDDKYEK